VPRAVASILTLAVCALVTYFLLRLAERYVGDWLKRRDAETDDGRVRHVMFSAAAFLAFITFYSFAGAPTLWKAPWVVPQLFIITVVLTATLFLARRLRRTQKTFAEETLAKNIIKRWEWTDITPPKDLREAFIIHTIKSKETAKGSAQVLEIYKDAVREAVANGFVTREEVQLLESLRNQLQIKKSDHDKVMEALAEEERAMFADPSKQISAEKRLQLETYEHALRHYLEGVFASESAPDDRLITQLRSEYRVTRDEHAAVLDEILGGSQGIASRLAEEISSIERAAKTLQALELQPSPTHDFLMALLRRRRVRALDRLMRGLSFTLQEEEGQAMRAALLSSDDTARKSVIESLGASVAPVIAERLASAYRETAAHEASLPTLTDMLIARTGSVDPYVRAVSLYALGERGAANSALLERMGADEHEVVRETAQHLAARARSGEGEGRPHAGLITIEKMIALRSAPIFSNIAPEGLAELARACLEDKYGPNEALCFEGEPGNEVFILLAGDVQVLKTDGTGDERLLATEKAGGFIGEMAVLDPAPRSATLRAGAGGVRVLRLDGTAFRLSLNNDSTIASSVIRTLAQRLRQK
jgi:hypothetical protein